MGFRAKGDAGSVVVVDGREGAEEQTGDVDESCGAASGDAVASDELIKLAEGMVDALCGLKLNGSFDQRSIKIGVLVESFFPSQMLGAKTGLWVSGVEAASATAGGKKMRAAIFCYDGFGGKLGHGVN